MHTVTLKFEDSNIYEHIMFLLHNLDAKGMEITEEKKQEDAYVDFSKYNIKSFKSIDNPTEYQKTIRDEWS